MILGITGMRPSKLFGYDLNNNKYIILKQKIASFIKEIKPNLIISGMAQGVDWLAVEIAIIEKIPFLAAVPHEGQEKIWPKPAQEKYYELLSQASKVVTVVAGLYAPWKMQKRNQYIVDSSDRMLAVWDQVSAGGTCNCVTYCREIDKSLDIIDIRTI